MAELDYDLGKTLKWCAENEVTFKVTYETGKPAITAKCGFVFAQYLVDEPLDAGAVGNAVWASLFAVKHGTQFHERYGHYPPVADSDRAKEAGNSASGNESGESRDVPHSGSVSSSSPLSTNAVPRRS